jgi:hypothetical protein
MEKRKSLTLPELELRPLDLQPVASRYTDYTISAPIKFIIHYFILGSPDDDFNI